MNENLGSANKKHVVGSPVFICGHGSSGTTLLLALLDGHSQLLVIPEETYFLNKITHDPGLSAMASAEWLLAENARKVESGLNQLILDDADEEAACYVDAADFGFYTIEKPFFAILKNGPRIHSRVLESLATAFAEHTNQAGKKYWVEKTPGNESHLHLASEWYSDMRAIYIIRDPRDVFLSHARKMRAVKKSDAIEKFVYKWGMSVWFWCQFTAENSNCLTLRFEDLLHHPRETMALICRFLDIEYEPILDVPTKSGKMWLGNSPHGDKFTGISTRPIGRWRERLPQEQLTVLEAYLGKAMGWLGYQLATESPSLSQIVGYWLHHRRKRKQILGMVVRLYWPFQLPKRLELRRTW